jgi:hypothetical protein
MSVEKIMYKLECGDIVLAPSFLVNGKLNCITHGKQRITDIPVYEWRVKCTCCVFARWTGMSQALATTLGTMHVIRNSGHDTYQEYTKRPAAENTRKKYMAYHGISKSANI